MHTRLCGLEGGINLPFYHLVLLSTIIVLLNDIASHILIGGTASKLLKTHSFPFVHLWLSDAVNVLIIDKTQKKVEPHFTRLIAVGSDSHNTRQVIATPL